MLRHRELCYMFFFRNLRLSIRLVFVVFSSTASGPRRLMCYLFRCSEAFRRDGSAVAEHT